MIADSSFYICFLDDITCPSFLNTVLSGPFQFLVTPTVHDEIKRSKNYTQIQRNNITEMDFPFDISRILKPFFGKDETVKGEHEVIAFAYILYYDELDFGIILDEKTILKSESKVIEIRVFCVNCWWTVKSGIVYGPINY